MKSLILGMAGIMLATGAAKAAEMRAFALARNLLEPLRLEWSGL